MAIASEPSIFSAGRPIAPAARDPGLPALLRGDLKAMAYTVRDGRWQEMSLLLGVIMAGAGLFGAATGVWRAPLQAAYTGIKFPLIVLLTMLGNGLLNGMLAPLLGLNLGLRQAFLAVMMSFAIMAAILGALAPLMAFLVWNVPPMGTPGVAYGLILLSQVAAIALAGTAGNARLLRFLEHTSGSRTVARRVFVVWLAINLFLGAQLAWNLRPFTGSPGLPVEFLRANAFEGNFFEAVFHAVRSLLNP